MLDRYGADRIWVSLSQQQNKHEIPGYNVEVLDLNPIEDTGRATLQFDSCSEPTSKKVGMFCIRRSARSGEDDEKAEKAEKADKTDQNSDKEPEKTKSEPQVTEPKIPDIFIQTKTQTQPQINLPILTTGITERELLSILGQPSTSRNDPKNNGKILIYQDKNSNSTNYAYHANSKGTIRQANIALSEDLSLGTMQDSMAKLLGGNPSVDAKNKLREVYNRKTSRQSFRFNRLKGSIYRDYKNRVNISVWEKNS